MKGSLPSLAQRETVWGDTCRISATSAVSRKLGLSIVALPWRLAATVRPFVNPDSAGVPEPGMDRLFVDRDGRTCDGDGAVGHLLTFAGTGSPAGSPRR